MELRNHLKSGRHLDVEFILPISTVRARKEPMRISTKFFTNSFLKELISECYTSGAQQGAISNQR